MKAKSFCLLSCWLVLGLIANAVLPSNAAAQIRMMPLGNSITAGVGSSNAGGYRYYLYNKLKNANIAFDFVGSLKGGAGFPDNDHEGHGGLRADQLAVETYLTANPAAAVFLEIGTNNVSNTESAAPIRDEIASVVDQIHNFDATIEIYLGTVIPRKDSNGLQLVTDNLNALLPDLVSAKSAAGYKIYLVDHAARFKADPNWPINLMHDNVHPNDAGYDLMAQEWFAAFVNNTGAPTTLAAFSGDGASGEVNQEMPAPLTVRVTDAIGNGVDSVHVFFELIQGSGTLIGGHGTPSTRDVTTSGGGLASTKITFGAEVGPRKIRITALGVSGLPLSGPPLTFTVFGRAGELKSIEAITRTNNQRGTAGWPLNFPLQVIAYDNQRNPVEGVQINFSVTQNTGYFPDSALNALVLTNSKGIAEVEWTIKAGTNIVQASAVGLQAPPIRFEAIGVTDNKFPILADIPNQQKLEGDRIEFVVRATDDDNEPIRYGAKNLPLSAVFDSLGTHIFAWQSGASSAGHYEMSFMAYDMRGGVDEEVVSVDILNRNQPPVITSRFPVGNRPGKPDTTLLQAGTPLHMRVAATDPDGDVLSYRWYVDGKFAGSIFDTFEFRGELAWNDVEAVVFDFADTVRTVWSIKVPVELTSFTAHVGADDGVKLRWHTGSEINNAGFNVLRSRSQSEYYSKLNDQFIPVNRDGNYTFTDATAEAGARYYYKLEVIDTRGNVATHGPIVVEVASPATFDLSQNYPNPFWSEAISPARSGEYPTTNIRYQLPKAVQVRLTIYNMLGQEVRKLVDGQQLPAGYHTVVWDGRDQFGRLASPGVYFYRLQAGKFTLTKKLLLAK